ncbi:energy transducer TonB [Luteibacter yeojuensis]|uniref:Energy transducer TonB n=1 Tax=Luteibacter yeojuensis TaxID=345309 RepID=A0A7X5QUQ8_9GAMM|nr:energy transducer TonB [Luteibacter yeojuensis]NID15793.1 energy transducer TonB [Luteibacter yeojuensis]
MIRNSLFTGAIAVAVLFAAGTAEAQTLRKVSPDRLTGYWFLTNKSLDVDVPNTGKNLNQPGCAAVSYMIGSDGRTQNPKIEKVVPEGDLGQVGVSIVRQLTYVKGSQNGTAQPVQTYYVAGFNLPEDPARKAAILAKCELPGYQTT